MKKLFALFAAAVILISAFAFTACYGGGNGDNKIPEEGKVDAEIFKLIGNDYEEPEGAFLDVYRTPNENFLVAVLQVRNTGALLADYSLYVGTDALPESAASTEFELFVAEFFTAPQLVSDAMKNGEFESFGLLSDKGTLVSTGSIKVGSAKYFAVMIELPDSCDDELAGAVAKAVTVEVGAVKHVPVIVEE